MSLVKLYGDELPLLLDAATIPLTNSIALPWQRAQIHRLIEGITSKLFALMPSGRDVIVDKIEPLIKQIMDDKYMVDDATLSFIQTMKYNIHHTLHPSAMPILLIEKQGPFYKMAITMPVENIDKYREKTCANSIKKFEEMSIVYNHTQWNCTNCGADNSLKYNRYCHQCLQDQPKKKKELAWGQNTLFGIITNEQELIGTIPPKNKKKKFQRNKLHWRRPI